MHARPLARASQHCRGASALALLIVVAIILFLSFGYFGGEDAPKDKVQEVKQGIRDIEKARVVTCETNRVAIKTNVTMWQINNSGSKMTPEVYSQLNLPRCPGDGIYFINDQGTVYCTDHFPPSAAEMQSLLQLTLPAPAAAPPPAMGTPLPQQPLPAQPLPQQQVPAPAPPVQQTPLPPPGVNGSQVTLPGGRQINLPSNAMPPAQ